MVGRSGPGARAAALALGVALLAAAPATAGSRFTIRGAGFGHGVGMSQYGAMGYAKHGWDYQRILAHYYTGTALGRLDGPREVRVLLQSTAGTAAFSGASRGAGRKLRPASTYRVRGRAGGRVQLLSARGRALATVTAPLRVSGPGPLVLRGRAGNGRSGGAYRGALEFRPGVLGGVNAINAVALDDYVQGVVPLESPASWPLEALKAQAVAARTYAITSSKSGDGFEHYPDVRSQVYGGVGAETASTNQATQETAAQLVTYGGTPVTTYFFSTSGGRTEDVENTSLGREPRPWLRSVEDAYDDASPRHRWGPIRLSYAAAGRRLGKLVKGSFQGIEVVRRGSSPRVVEADVVGSAGRTRVTGAVLRARLGLSDTWAFFTSISTGEAPTPDAVAGLPPAADGEPASAAAPAGRLALLRHAGAISGRVLPAERGAALVVQRRQGWRWADVAEARVGARGRYRVAVGQAGLYRVRYAGATGPVVRVG